MELCNPYGSCTYCCLPQWVHHFPANSSPPVTLDGNKQIIKKKKKKKQKNKNKKKKKKKKKKKRKKGTCFL
jgi:hypothetical protein